MDFGALPPEVNSGRMYLGPGPATLLAAAAAWDALAAELGAAAGGYESVVTILTNEWLGPTSMSMAAVVAPYVLWMRAIAEQCEQAGIQAAAATAAYETAYAMTVPPPLIATNRAQLMALIATNFVGQNTPAIMAAEAQYGEMWAQDAAAMYSYAAASAAASTFSAFTSPPQTTNPGGAAGQAGAVAQATATQAGGHVQTASAHAMSSVPQALQGLATPGSSSSGTGLSSAAMGTGASLGSSGASTPLGALSSLTGTSKGAGKGASTGLGAVQGVSSALGGAAGSGDTAGLASDAIGLGSDFAGLGADGAGLGGDGAGVGMDVYGLGLDMEGAGSIIGAEGGVAPGLGNLGNLGALGNLGPIGGLGATTSASVGQASALGTLSVPPTWAETVSSVAPLPAFDAPVAGSVGAVPSPATGTGISKLPLGAMVGRESDGAVHRIGLRPSLFPRSPVAG
ncbi:PPE family protein [Mycobacterium vulneris]|jgi:PPE-repeat protein|uniref:PPE family protein n=1 Tax=Mycolicibacterium vulneris TaxID=547163 RepID=A0A1X2L4M7_9MYCO|nr:PPE family protein [Mycolicibacterium vulneris]OSC28887.1 PPE family protein [Mycolicibacterium vulneris]